jgi:monoamine oxidase
VKRREVLKSLGYGVTAGLALPAWLSSCSEDEKGPEVKYDGVVGIVGAGAAGLAVADYLISKGVKVKIFEASSRIGGRVESLSQSHPLFNILAADFPVELGADRVFGTDSEFGKIIQQERFPKMLFREAPTNAVDFYIINGEYVSQGDAEARADFQSLKTFRDSGLAAYTGGGSIEAAAGASADMKGVLNSWLGNAYGSSADQIGASAMGEALTLTAETHDRKEFTLRAYPIINVLTSRYDNAVKKVKLNSAVKTINSPAGAETITLTILNPTDGSETTETVTKLVVTSPVKILKDSTKMTFTQGLPGTKVAAMNRIGMDTSIRIIIEFRLNSFFRTDTTLNVNPAFIFGGEECPSYFLAGVGRSKFNVTVSLTINGPKAEELSLLPDAEKIERILDEMDVVFDGAASENIRKYFPEDVPPDVDPTNPIIYLVKDWSKVAYVGGGQSYPMVGGTNADRVELAAPIDDKLFFAGEATDFTGEFGTISGAIKSGERAAEEVIAAILAENAAS